MREGDMLAMSLMRAPLVLDAKTRKDGTFGFTITDHDGIEWEVRVVSVETNGSGCGEMRLAFRMIA